MPDLAVLEHLIKSKCVLLLVCCPALELSTYDQRRFSSDDLREPGLYKTTSMTCCFFLYELLRKPVTLVKGLSL